MRNWYKATSTCILILFFTLGTCHLIAQDRLLITKSYQTSFLTDIFDDLKESYGLEFAYATDILPEKAINLTLQASEVTEAMEALLTPLGLTFSLVGNSYILVKRHKPQKDSPEITIEGKVIDKETGEALAYSAVYLANGVTGTVTDDFGKFSLTFPANEMSSDLMIQYLGYKTVSFPIIPGKSPIIVEMETNTQEINPIVIVDRLPFLQSYLLHPSIDMNQRKINFPTFNIKDPLRALQLLPGVAAHDELSAGLKVRGGREDENLYILDGITLYNVDHFFGIFSSFDANVIDDVTLHKSFIPSQYGGRASSVVELNSKEHTSTFNGVVDVNLLTSSLYADLPIIKDKFSLSGGLRFTNYNLSKTKFFGHLFDSPTIEDPNVTNRSSFPLIDVEPGFGFNDYYVKAKYKIKRGEISASYFASRDQFDYDIEQQFENRIRNLIVMNRESYKEDVNWNNIGYQLSFKKQWNKNFFSKVGFNTSEYEYEESSIFELERRFVRQVKNFEISNKLINSVSGKEGYLHNRVLFGKDHYLSLGYQYLDQKTSFYFDHENKKVVELNPGFIQQSVYTQWDKTFLNFIKINAGLRSTYHGTKNKWYTSPRIYTSLLVSGEFSIKFMAGKYNQFLSTSSIEDRFGRVRNFYLLPRENLIEPIEASHLSLGAVLKNRNFDLDIEFYKIDRKNITQYAQPVPGFEPQIEGPNIKRNYRWYVGTGEVKGMDVLLKRQTKNYLGWFSYTLSKSDVSFKAIDRGVSFPAQDDRRHQFKTFHQVDLKKWSFSASYIFASGRPYLDISLIEENAEDRSDLTISEFYNFIDSYHRLDLGINYNFSINGNSAQFGLSLINALDNENVKYRQYVYTIQKDDVQNGRVINQVLGNDVNLLGTTLNASFTWEF